MTKLVPVALAALLLCACAAQPNLTTATASAALAPTTANNASGVVTFSKQSNGVRVEGEVRGLQPNAEHGFHIHEKGDCSSGDGMSTGGHFNPTAQPHGAHSQSEHHAGDLVSLQADGNGVARFSYTSTTITVGEGPTDIIGRGLIVHRDADDYRTQPTGNSGPRIACAVIAKG